jgi:hypothetical protein
MFPSRTFLSVPKILLSILTHCTYSEDVSGNSSKCARFFWKIVTNKPSLFNICCLNVCGLMSKLKDPDFLNIFQNYDILFFQETKTDNLDHLLILFSTECVLLASPCLLS